METTGHAAAHVQVHVKIKERKTLKSFMDSFKENLIDLFKEEGDTHLQ